MKHREIAYCGLFGAAALLLPVFFHLFHLGHVFMPMYLPLVALAFFVGPVASALTALVVPILSGAVTGMPPFYPPIGPVMSLELAVMAFIIGSATRLLPRLHALIVLIPTLLIGRGLYVVFMYLAAQMMDLPPKFVAGISFFGGWPGLILMVVVIPSIVCLSKETSEDDEDINMADSVIADPRIPFFDDLSERWDILNEPASATLMLIGLLSHFKINPKEKILDVGCGTGNMTAALLNVLGAEGHVVAIDISEQMLKKAKLKITDPRVTWIRAEAANIPVSNTSFDRIFCYSVWPHFKNIPSVVTELNRIMRKGAYLHILHTVSKEKVNEIHSAASHSSVHHDLLEPAEVTAQLLKEHGFIVHEVVDNDSRYLVTAQKK